MAPVATNPNNIQDIMADFALAKKNSLRSLVERSQSQPEICHSARLTKPNE